MLYLTEDIVNYMRCLKDLPMGEREVQLFLCSNKWFCDDPCCTVKVFTERLNWIEPYRYRRKTRRLEEQLTALAFSTSCLQAERLCKSFHISVSHDALLDLIYRTKCQTDTHFPFRWSG
ncbi:MAG: transposase [Neobacillus sp.]|nr:transposase [Neobacillus sp.]